MSCYEYNKFYIFFIKTPRPSLWRGLHQYTTVLTLSCYGRRARQSPRAMFPSPRKKNLGLVNSRGGMYIEQMKVAFNRWDKKLEEISDEMRKMDEHVTRLEHGARQPRLAMEADGQTNTKTRERTEGAATAVQSMHGDGFSARRVEPDPNTNSTSFGVKAEPPALPCRDGFVVECGDAASESCLPPLEVRSSTAAGGLVPTGEASKAKETNFNQLPLRLCSTEETDHLEANCKKTWISSTSYDSSGVFQERNLAATLYCRSLTQNPGKIGPLIQAVWKVTSAPAHFWDRGARWFVARLYGLGQLVKNCSVFLEEIRWPFETRPVLMPCQEKKSRRRGLLEATWTWGRNRGHDVMVTWGDWKLGANGCRGTSWSDELFGANSLTATSRRGLLLSEISQGFKDIRTLKFTIWYAEKCTRVML